MAWIYRRPNAESDCASCERFIGPALTCPYCDADAPTRLTKLRLRVIALILAGGGLILLWFSARQHLPPTRTIASLSPSMNFAVVRVEGIIRSSAEIRHSPGQQDYFSLVVEDDTGTLPVFASGPLVDELKKQLPSLIRNQPLRVTGTLTLGRHGTLKLRLTHLAAIRLLLDHPPPSSGSAQQKKDAS